MPPQNQPPQNQPPQNQPPQNQPPQNQPPQNQPPKKPAVKKAALPEPLKPGAVYKHRTTGHVHTVTKVEQNIPFGSGTDHRVWFRAPHDIDERGWPQNYFLAEMEEPSDAGETAPEEAPKE